MYLQAESRNRKLGDVDGFFFLLISTRWTGNTRRCLRVWATRYEEALTRRTQSVQDLTLTVSKLSSSQTKDRYRRPPYVSQKCSIWALSASIYFLIVLLNPALQLDQLWDLGSLQQTAFSPFVYHPFQNQSASFVDEKVGSTKARSDCSKLLWTKKTRKKKLNACWKQCLLLRRLASTLL